MLLVVKNKFNPSQGKSTLASIYYISHTNLQINNLFETTRIVRVIPALWCTCAEERVRGDLYLCIFSKGRIREGLIWGPHLDLKLTNLSSCLKFYLILFVYCT